MVSKLFNLFIVLLYLSSCQSGSVDRITESHNPSRPPVNSEVRNEVRNLVERCVTQMSDDSFRVSRRIPTSNNGPQIDALYTIRRGEAHNPIAIDLNIYAIYEDPAVIPRLQAMLPGVEGFFERYGIKINLNFEFSIHLDHGRSIFNDKIIRLLISNCRSNMLTWCFPVWEDSGFWIDISHELGHALGLADEYEDSLFPNRFIPIETNPVSIMQLGAPANYLDFYPRHIKQILEPVCPNL